MFYFQWRYDPYGKSGGGAPIKTDSGIVQIEVDTLRCNSRSMPVKVSHKILIGFIRILGGSFI